MYEHNAKKARKNAWKSNTIQYNFKTIYDILNDK